MSDGRGRNGDDDGRDERREDRRERHEDRRHERDERRDERDERDEVDAEVEAAVEQTVATTTTQTNTTGAITLSIGGGEDARVNLKGADITFHIDLTQSNDSATEVGQAADVLSVDAVEATARLPDGTEIDLDVTATVTQGAEVETTQSNTTGAITFSIGGGEGSRVNLRNADIAFDLSIHQSNESTTTITQDAVLL